MEIITRTTCRLCGSNNLKEVLSLGSICVSDFVEEGKETISAPLDLVLCGECELVQLRHTAPQEIMYSRHYWYESKLNQVIVDDLKEIVDEILKVKKFGHGKGGIWIDVGSNDGALLDFVSPKHIERIGVEPAKNLSGSGYTECKIFWEDFNEPECHADVITAIGMFYDSEDPNRFVGNITKHLASDGIFVAQLMTLKPMLESNDVANICHEHLEYYSYKSLVKLFESNGLEIYKVEENSINGGSYRIFARHFRDGSIEHPESIDLEKFKENIEKNKKEVVDFIRDRVKFGDKVYGYAASTKGNTILQYFGLTPEDIVGVAEKNPEKIGKLCVGSNIPIVSEEEAREKADYFLILPWGFKDLFIKKEKKLGYRGRFILHTPKFLVV